MRAFYSTDHAGHWPVGVASVVFARDEQEAHDLLAQKLTENGLDAAQGFTLAEIDTSVAAAHVLVDGNY